MPGKVVADTWHDWAKSFPNAPADVARFLLGSRVTHVRRRGKVLMIELSSGYSLVIHLKMTGQLVFIANQKQTRSPKPETKPEAKKNDSKSLGSEAPNLELERTGRFGAGHPSDSLVNALPDKSTRVVLDFTDGSKLFFNDQRKFGWMRLLPTVQVPEIDFFKKIGPEPLDADFTVDKFIERLQKRPSSAIKAVLLDQTVLAGVGNIYADEALFLARIHPQAKVGGISRTKLVALHGDLQDVLKLSISKGGSTDRNYVNAEGQRGSYIEFAKVFRRQNQPCPRCGTPIAKIRVAGRGTHICPRCQRRPKGKS